MDYLFIFMCACIFPVECILYLMKVFPNTLGSSMFSLLISLRILAFLISSSIIVSFYYITLWIDYIIKIKFKDSSLFSTLYLPEIKTYQYFFVFTLLPILFSYIKTYLNKNN